MMPSRGVVHHGHGSNDIKRAGLGRAAGLTCVAAGIDIPDHPGRYGQLRGDGHCGQTGAINENLK